MTKLKLTLLILGILIVIISGFIINKDKEVEAQIDLKPLPELATDLSYISIDLIDKYQAGTVGWKNLDPKCLKECTMTLEIYDLIDDLNRYIKENNFKAVNVKPTNDYIKQITTQMKLDKTVYDLSIKEKL